jgi:hypothetical protein
MREKLRGGSKVEWCVSASMCVSECWSVCVRGVEKRKKRRRGYKEELCVSV